MIVRDVMYSDSHSLPQNSPLQEAFNLLASSHRESVPIVDAALRVVGVISIDHLVELFIPRYHEVLRDFAALQDKGQLASLFGLTTMGIEAEQKLILVADVMNTELDWVRIDDSLLQAASKLQSQGLMRLPVVDRDMKLVGTIADYEISLALLTGQTIQRTKIPS